MTTSSPTCSLSNPVSSAAGHACPHPPKMFAAATARISNSHLTVRCYFGEVGVLSEHSLTVTERKDAWAQFHANTPPGWFVGRPGQRRGGQWEQYAFDPKERAHMGRRSREWTAVGNTEVECVREMARCLRAISEGRAPK